MMNNIDKLDKDYFIGNITTDGFSTDFPNDEELWRKISDDKLINLWLKSRSIMEGRKIENFLADAESEKNVIEKKHTVYQYIGWRTRGQATLSMQLNTPAT